MTPTLTYRPMRPATERARVADLIAMAFGGSLEDCHGWMDRAGTDVLRVVALPDGTIASCLLLADLGQFFGGKSVPMIGVAGVATAPEHRGVGAATFMMRQAVLEMHARGAALSALYPATQPVYRRVGYEQAGSIFEHRVKLAGLRTRAPIEDRALSAREAGEHDLARLDEAYRRAVSSENGWLERRTYIWPRVIAPRGKPARGWLFEGEQGVEGWVFFTRSDEPIPNSPHRHYTMRLCDARATTPRGWRRLLAFIADYESVIREAIFDGGPAAPLGLMLPEQRYTVSLVDHWMLRVVDVERALTARGYPAGLSARLVLDVRDDLIEANTGRFLLEVTGGEGRVTRGAGAGAPSLGLDVRDLAPLYSGFLTARHLAAVGHLEGDPRALDIAEAVFAGPHPSMGDRF